MHIIQNNPYRTVGLLVGATAKEQVRQIKRLNQFIDAEQEPEDDFSFPALGKIIRTVDNVTDSASKLNLDKDKMNASLFWFYNGNPITDEPAFDALKDADIDQAINIWSKLTSTAEVSQRNASAHSNLGTLYLSQNTNEDVFEKGISLKLKFLESDFIKDFKALATDETYKTNKKELQLIFLNQIQTEIEKSGGITSNKFLEILSKQTFSAKEDFLKGFVQKPIEQIEKQIEETRKKQKANPAKAGDYGNELFKITKPLLTSIISILSKSNIKVISISDKIANEILQCGISLFNHFHETGTEVGEIALDINKKAKSIVLGSVVKERINESISVVERYVADRPEREKQKIIGKDLQIITSKLEKFQDLSDTVSNAKDLIDSCKPRLVSVKNALGSTDDFYLKISSAVVSNAQGMLVTAVNEAQEGLKNTNSFDSSLPEIYYDAQGKMKFKIKKTVSLSELSTIINTAYDVTTSMQSMDMVSNLKQSFIKNREALGSLKNQINAATNRTTSSSSRSSGCYIATMAYGNYDHPQVMILRQFRDEVLDKSAFGKWFIKKYYHYSPKLVERLKNQRNVNIIIRKALNQFIKLIK
jgi:hypothetical protein